MVNVDRYGNTSSGSIPLALADAAEDGRLREGELVLMTGMGAGLTWGSAFWNGRRRGPLDQDRFHVPGPGLVRGRHGTRDRRGRARGDGGVRGRQRSGRNRPEEGVLRRTGRGHARHEGAAAGARRHEPRDQPGDPLARASSPTTSSATRSASSRRSARPSRSASPTRSGSCASAGSRWRRPRSQHPGSMAAILGLTDEVVESLCRKIHNVWPANYNCPGQIVISGEDDAVGECCERGRAGGRAPCGAAARLGCVPLAARRPRRRPAAAGGREDPLLADRRRRSCRR